MIVSADIKPDRLVYHLGAIVIKELSELEIGEQIDILSLRDRVAQTTDVSLESVLLALDWLFLLGSVGLSDDGEGIVKCF